MDKYISKVLYATWIQNARYDSFYITKSYIANHTVYTVGLMWTSQKVKADMSSYKPQPYFFIYSIHLCAPITLDFICLVLAEL